MDDEKTIELLRASFGESFQATREGGRQSMAELLEARASLPIDAALEEIDRLQAAGQLHFSGLRDLGDDSTLEAARYGTVPVAASDEGRWQIGPPAEAG